MKLSIGCICEWAGYTQDQKLIIIGIFEGMSIPNASQLAIVPLAPCYLVLRFELENSEVGKHAVGLRLVDADRKIVLEPAPMSIDVQPNRPSYPLSSSVVAPIIGLQVPGVGDYEFLVTVDGQELGAVPLHVEEAPG